MNGIVIFYGEDGNEIKRETYENGKLIDEGKFATSADNPLIGTWKYVEYGSYQSPINGGTSTYVKRTLIVTYFQSGVVEVTSQSSYSTAKEKRNWKYIPKTATTGIEEDYQGDELMERDSIRWINNNQFEATVIFHQSTSLIGEKLIFTRQ